MTLPATLHPEQRIDAPVVMALVGCERSEFYRLVREGHLPPPVVQRRRFTRWRAGDILDALAREAA